MVSWFDISVSAIHVYIALIYCSRGEPYYAALWFILSGVWAVIGLWKASTYDAMIRTLVDETISRIRKERSHE